MFVWDLATNKQLASWKLDEPPFGLALIGRNVYVATIDLKATQSAYGIGENAIIKLSLNDPNICIFERASGRLLFFMQTSSRVWYVEKVWIHGRRMIFTTDTGVMIDGNIVANKN